MSKTITNLKWALVHFQDISEKLPSMTNGPKLIKLFNLIHNKAVILSDNYDFSPDFTPVNEVDGDSNYGIVESGEDMLFYYQDLIRNGVYDTSNTDVIYDVFVGGSKIKYDDCLYVMFPDENYSYVYEETPLRVQGIVQAIIRDLAAYIHGKEEAKEYK